MPQFAAHVILSGRHAGRGGETVAAIRAQGGTADFVATDLNNAASVRVLAKRATELGGGHVDILANMALYGSSKAALVLLTN